jgi:LuxR family maltose regulon positive regulatory protein
MDEGQGMATTRPVAHSTIIKRPRLTRLLDESEARILLLCAPAGYGKTTLAREWIATQAEPVAWYRGGIEMLDAAAVALALIEVLRGVGLQDDDAARLTARASRTTRPADLGRAIGSAVPNPSEAILVIDDYHHAESSESEALLEAFVDEVDLRILITSRTRPAWLTSRMLVYGEALVVGADELAFTADEARAVLASEDAFQPHTFVAQARGWPAVIGLAARQGSVGKSQTGSLLPAQLYDYFADDLLRRAPARLRRDLFLLALSGGSDSCVTQELLGDECDHRLAEAAERGFISRRSSLQFEMHPLLQSFLLAKLHELDDTQGEELAECALRSLGKAHRWDDCLAVLVEFPGTMISLSLLSQALDELLASGRLATIKRWLSLLPQAGGVHAVVLLAEAEVAVREGRDALAQMVAEQAAALSPDTELAARAHLVAARAAHMRCDEPGARHNAQRAASLASVDHIRTDARRIELMSAFEAEDERAHDLLTQLQDERHPSPEQRLLCCHATGFLGLLAAGNVRQALRDLEPGLGLLKHVSNPLARTAFLNILSTTWLWLAEYRRALEVVDLQTEDAKASGLDFAEDHALTIRAAALIGLRRLGAAQRVLAELESRGPHSGFIVNEVHLLTARLRATAGDIERAEIILRGRPPMDGVTRSALGERLAWRSLYLSAIGDVSTVRSVVREAARTSSYLGTRSLRELALVIVSLREQPSSGLTKESRSALAQIIKLGQLDGLVFACRVYPELATHAASDDALAHELTTVLAGSRDIDIGRAAGLEMPRDLRRTEGLSIREREVFELLAQGRSNPEIAKALFISESTTKVHVRHNFEKLKVHSRAAAAAMKIDADD